MRTNASAIPLDCGLLTGVVQRDEPDVAGERASIAFGVAASVVGQRLDRFAHAVQLSASMLDGGDHQIPDVFGRDAAARRDMPHLLTIAAALREGDTHILAIVAADLQPVRAPAGIALIDSYTTVVAAFFATFAVPLEQQPGPS